jgi:hypothetical protein
VNEDHFDMAVGSVYLEIPMMLSSESGQEKHIDLNNQGLFLAFDIARLLKASSTQGAAVSEITFWGTTKPGNGEFVRRIDFGKDL